MGALQTDTTLREKDGVLTASLSRDWEIWGPNGGYVASIALRAAGRVAPAGHRPATISVQYLSAAQFDDVTIETDPVRKGRNAWCINVALVQNGKRFLQAQVWTTDKSEGPSNNERKMPDVPKPSALHPFEHYLPKDAPKHGFWMNFEGRPLKFLERGERDPKGAVSQNWYRFIDFENTDDPFLDSARALLLIDTVVWPAHHRGLVTPPDYIAPSLDVTVWFHQTAGRAQWLFVDGDAATAGQGLIHGTVHVWTEDGRLIATGGSHLLQVTRK